MAVCSACPLRLSFCKEQSPLRADKRHMKQSYHHCCTQSRHNQSTTVLRYFSVTLCRQPLGTAMGPPLAQPPLPTEESVHSEKPRQEAKSAALSPLLSLTAHSLAATLRHVPMLLLTVSLQTQPVCQIPPSVSPSPRSIC